MERCGPMVGLPATATTLNGFEATAVSRKQTRDGVMAVLEYRPGKDLHSGVFGGAVANPSNALAHIVGQLHDEHGHVQIPGFYDDVVVEQAGKLLFREKTVVLDSNRVDTLLVIPV